MATRVAFESLRAAGDGGEDVVAVHGAEDQLGPVPHLGAGRAPTLKSGTPALQTAHADCRQVTQPPIRLDLDTRCCVLSGRDEECSVNQRIPLKDDHLSVAEDAGDLVHLVSRIAGEDEASRLVVADTALILHLDVIRVDFLFWENIERTVIISAEEDAASTVVPGSVPHADLSGRQLALLGRGGGGGAPAGGPGVGA